VRHSEIAIRPDPQSPDPFHVGDDECGRPGLDLGLAIAHHIVALHGGSLSACWEEEGRWMILSMFLPMACIGLSVGTRGRGEGPH
jgi:K+-sensing histidine kinase KdpD